MMDVFVPTLGRSSLHFCLKALKKAGCPHPHIIKDMQWVEACNLMANSSSSEWFLRVDDDFFMCPWSLGYIKNCTLGYRGAGMISFNLYDWRTQRAVRGVKVYRTSVAKDVGFSADTNGRVDKVFAKRLADKKINMVIKRVVVGMHAHTPDEEQLKSWAMRGERSPQKYKSLLGVECNYQEQMAFLNSI
jgi:hypothetical protein